MICGRAKKNLYVIKKNLYMDKIFFNDSKKVEKGKEKEKVRPRYAWKAHLLKKISLLCHQPTERA